MNIFVSSPDPRLSAIVLDDLRCNKMIIESAQMMSTALREHGVDYGYKYTHITHPCTKWVARSYENYIWVWEHYMWLNQEFFQRRSKLHKSYHMAIELFKNAEVLTKNGLTPFVNCANVDSKDTHEAYKKCLLTKWSEDKRKPTWNGRTYEINDQMFDKIIKDRTANK